MEELETGWINEFENKEKVYERFYQDKVTAIKVFSLYVNKNCVLDKVKEDKYTLQNDNLLKKIELLNLIKKKKKDEGINYKLISLIKHNIDLKPSEIKGYVLEEKEYRFLDYLRELKDISFHDTIEMFDDLNSIFLVYYEYTEKFNQNKTKKVYFNTSNHSRHKKTKRKALKD